jgi:N-acetylmuramic acid 6-phosphate etherase
MIPDHLSPAPTAAEAPAEPAMATEIASPRYEALDEWPSREVVAAMYESQLAAVAAIGPAVAAIAEAGDKAAARLVAGDGRLVYAGAGTSGRIGVQDGTELVPTYDWPEHRLLFAMAGGDRALRESTENAEDDGAAAEEAVARLGLGAADVVIGVAASGTTPYTIAFIAAARARGALTIAVANNPASPLAAAAECPITVATGPEVVAGSTRMKAGTAQKAVLNLLSTLIMIRLGRVYRGLMVNMRAKNAKLERRAVRMVARLTGVDTVAATAAVDAAGGDVKTAVLVAGGVAPAEAVALIAGAGGNLRLAVARAAAGRSRQGSSP